MLINKSGYFQRRKPVQGQQKNIEQYSYKPYT